MLTNEQRFLKACKLRDEGNFREASDEFSELAELANNPIDKAEALLYGAKALELAGQHGPAIVKLKVVRALLESISTPEPEVEDKLTVLKLFLDFEDANLCWLQGDNSTA